MRPSGHEEGRVWQFEEPDTYREKGIRNGKNRKDSRRSSHGPQNGTGLDLDAINECLRTDDRTLKQ
jgi:hypothetical protein